MLKEIIWSPLSVSDIENTIEYLSDTWNDQIINEFLDEVDLSLQRIALYPRLYPIINKKAESKKVCCNQTQYYFLSGKEKYNSTAQNFRYKTRP